MGYWDRPNRFKHQNFIEIPEGGCFVKIYNVEIEEFKGVKKCFEITLDVFGRHGKLWFYLWYDPENQEKNNKKFLRFFQSFNIKDHHLSKYEEWKGKCGCVKVKHRIDEDEKEVQVIYCITGVPRKAFPNWSEATEKH